MGQLVLGEWQTDDIGASDNGASDKSASNNNGRFVRQDAGFRHWITTDGRAGPSGDGGFRAEAHRYHLYISWACPWAHRTIIFRKLKGLEEAIGLSVVNALMDDHGWHFSPGDGVIPDTVNGKERLHEIYTLAKRNYTGRVSVPVLWDKHSKTIVSNESSEIIRMFNSAFADVGALAGDYYPIALRTEIDEINDQVYHTVNNGVYKAGFAKSQEAYEAAATALFATFDELEARLSRQRYLVGGQVTEADWRLFPTLVRFDPVYVGHFKCNRKRLVDYPNLWAYTRDLYQTPGIAETVNVPYTKLHYYGSHESVNPTRIVPIGPEIDYTEPHDRDRFGSAKPS